MKQIAQNYKSGELSLLDVPVPACRPGGVIVRSLYSVISVGTEMMKVSESKLSLVGKARARPDQVAKVVRAVRQQGLLATYRKVINKLDSYTPLGYSLAGVVVEVGEGAEEFRPGQIVACGGNQYALHAEYNWVPVNLCVPVPHGVEPEQAAFATIGAISLQGLRQSEIKLGETACVIGLGLLGQVLVRLLRAAGVNVFGMDISPERCRMAEAAGAMVCAGPSGAEYEALAARLAATTGGAGADCIFLTANSKDAGPVAQAAELARDRARVIDIGKCNMDLPWSAYAEKELDIRFSRSYGPGRYDSVYEEGGIDYPIGYVRWTERRNMGCIVDMLADGRLDLKPLLSAIVPFDDCIATYEKLNGGALQGLGVLFRYDGAEQPQRRLEASAQPRAARVSAGRLRIGVIGCGNYASSMLLPHLAADSGVELAEVVTSTALSAANAMRKFGFARYSTEHESVLADPSVDGILIATRHASHARLTMAALRAGKAVFVEKPLAITREEMDGILEVVRETGNDRIMVGFNRRFAPLLVAMRNQWGPRGRAHTITYRVNAGPLDKQSWLARFEEEGGRFVGEGGHFIDTVSWWLGANPVEAHAFALPGDPDNLTATLRYDDGSVATIHYLTDGDARFPKERLDIFGEGRVASFDNFQTTALWQGSGRPQRGRGALDKGQKAQIAAFVQALRSDGPMPVSLASLTATTRATFAVMESAAQGGQYSVSVDAVP